MSTPGLTSVDELRRRSRRAALLSLLGLVFIGGTLVWSAFSLRRLDEQIAAKQSELSAVGAQIAEANKALEMKRRELASFERQYEIADRQWQQTLQVARNELPGDRAPVSAVVEPKASARRVGSNDYECYIWLNVPQDRVREIRSVTYTFNHPTFTEKDLSSSDPGMNFAVGYRGWGALRLVIIKLQLRNGNVEELAFDMAKALGLAGQAGGKVPFEPGANQFTPKVPITDIKRADEGGFESGPPNRN